jgi:hypothetical protein
MDAGNAKKVPPMIERQQNPDYAAKQVDRFDAGVSW